MPNLTSRKVRTTVSQRTIKKIEKRAAETLATRKDKVRRRAQSVSSKIIESAIRGHRVALAMAGDTSVDDLGAEFGLQGEGASVLEEIISFLKKNIKVNIVNVGSQGSRQKIEIRVTGLRREQYLSALSGLGAYESTGGFQIAWMWAVLHPTAHISRAIPEVREYAILYKNSPYSRSGRAIMVKRGSASPYAMPKVLQPRNKARDFIQETLIRNKETVKKQLSDALEKEFSRFSLTRIR